MSNLSKTNHPTDLAKAAREALAKYAQARGLNTLPTGVCILADVSGSMRALDGRSSRTRWDILKDALAECWGLTAAGGACYAFNGNAERLNSPADLPPASGGTYMARAAFEASPARGRYTAAVVISDGNPEDSPADVIETAKKTGIPFHTLYIGDRDDRYAIDFMKRLAQETGGNYLARDPKKLAAATLAADIKGLLPQ